MTNATRPVTEMTDDELHAEHDATDVELEECNTQRACELSARRREICDELACRHGVPLSMAPFFRD
jgi:hypothetical protein